MSSKLLCYLRKIIMLALVYYITGRLGLFLAVPPGYATAIWPPSGFALAGILLLGYRYWPGVLLGSFAVNLFTSFDHTHSTTMLFSSSIALCIACGAVLQAVFSAWLCRRYITFPNALEQTRDISSLLMLGGPVGCLINSFIGVSTLIASGLITLEKAPFNWLTWWVGDTIGVLIFTPIIILISSKSSRTTTRRKLAVSIALSIAFVATITVFHSARSWEKERAQLAFDKKAAIVAEKIEGSITDYSTTVYSVSLFYRASKNVERDEFKTFANGILERYPGIKSLSWAPKILDNERHIFEAAQRKLGFRDFNITEYGANQQMIPATLRDEYYPVTFIEPYMAKLHGFDNNSEEVRRTAMEKARDIGRRQITSRLNIIQQEKDNYGLVIFRPIYENGQPIDTIEQRRKNIKGYIAGAFIFPELIQAITPNKDPEIDFYIIDNNASPEKQLLYDSRTPDHKEAIQPLPLHADSITWQRSIEVPGRTWTVYCIQNPLALFSHQNWEIWFVLVGGLAFTGLLGVFVMVITARADTVQRLVEERTQQLIESEKQLANIVLIQRDIAPLHHDLQSAMNLIAESTRIITGAESSVIEMLEGDEMVYCAASGAASSHVGLRLQAANSLSGRCVRENSLLKCDDAETDDRVDKVACRKIGVVSMLAVPLTRGKHAVGVLKVLSSTPRAFNEKHIATLQLLAGVLSAALSDAIINEDLRQSEETFRSAMEHASIGMALVELSGRWLKVNNALCELVGYSKLELMRMDFQSMTYPDDLEADLENMRQMTAGIIQNYEIEKRYFHKDGRVIWVLLSVSLVHNADGTPKYFISQIQDITEQKEMERIKNEFISMVSHELRTPLTSIRGSLGLILGAFSKDMPEKVKGLIDIAHSNCERLILLINDILDIDKIAAGKMRFNLKKEALADITLQAVQANQAYAQKFHTHIELKSIDTSIKVNVDSSRYIQVLSNLLSNAVKFSPPEGIVEVYTTLKDSRVRVSVKDLGPGISEEFRTRIFGKFSQADSSATRAKGGTGLGLHIAKQIIEHMKGKIGFNTEVGKGTTFWIELPILDVDDPESNNTEPFLCYIQEPSDKPLILHVEDDLDLSNILATALYDHARVYTAHTLRKAEQLLSKQAFALIILDIEMPDGLGLDLLKRIEAMGDAAPPVIILCADAPPPEVYQQVEAVMIKSRILETTIIDTIINVLQKYKGGNV